MSMMRFYLYRQQIIIPTVAETEAGFYLDSEPVTICDVSAPELPACLLTQLVGQNPRVPTPERTDEPGSTVLESLGLKKWLKFEAEATMYTVFATDKEITFYATGRGPDRLWRQDAARQKVWLRALGAEAIIEQIREEILYDLASSEQAASGEQVKSGALMLLPPAENS